MAEFDSDGIITEAERDAATRKGFRQRARAAMTFADAAPDLGIDSVAQMATLEQIRQMPKPDAIKFRQGLSIAMETLRKTAGNVSTSPLNQTPEAAPSVVEHESLEIGSDAYVAPEVLSDGNDEAAAHEIPKVLDHEGEGLDATAPMFDEVQNRLFTELVRKYLDKDVLDVPSDDQTIGILDILAQEGGANAFADFNPPTQKKVGRVLEILHSPVGITEEFAQKYGATRGTMVQSKSAAAKRAAELLNNLYRGETTQDAADKIPDDSVIGVPPSEGLPQEPSLRDARERTQERSLDEEPAPVRLANEWAQYLDLDHDLKSALEEMLNPDGSQKLSDNKREVANKFWGIFVEKDGRVKTYDIDQKKIANLYRLFGIGYNSQSKKAQHVHTGPDMLARRVAHARSQGSVMARNEMIQNTHEGMRELLDILRAEKDASWTNIPELGVRIKPLQVGLVNGEMKLV